MQLEEKDNIYVLEEEKEQDSSPLNYAAYEDEEIENEEEREKEESHKISPFGLLLKIMFNPVEGWKSLRRSNIEVSSLQSGCFYPILAVLAISKFAEFFYLVNVNLSEIVTKAVIAFVAFFFGYFCVQMIISWLLPKNIIKNFDDKFGKEYIIIALTTLALFSILTDILPMLWPILIFLPLWTFYIMFKGLRFFKFPAQQEMKFLVIACAAVIGAPLAIEWLLNTVMPY